jgi:hypothetical protein
MLGHPQSLPSAPAWQQQQHKCKSAQHAGSKLSSMRRQFLLSTPCRQLCVIVSSSSQSSKTLWLLLSVAVLSYTLWRLLSVAVSSHNSKVVPHLSGWAAQGWWCALKQSCIPCSIQQCQGIIQSIWVLGVSGVGPAEICSSTSVSLLLTSHPCASPHTLLCPSLCQHMVSSTASTCML